MPVRRRISKSRPDELAAWRVMFTTGFDFFNELEPLSIKTESDARTAAPEAWARMGGDFMRAWRPTVNAKTPWALEEFGEP